jgi:hypothetical protein
MDVGRYYSLYFYLRLSFRGAAVSLPLHLWTPQGTSFSPVVCLGDCRGSA